MKWIQEEKVMDYADEQITVMSMAVNYVLFTGTLRNLKFHFDFSPDDIKANNTVECGLPGLAELKFYPHNILKSVSDDCKEHYEHVCENTSVNTSPSSFSQQTFSFANNSGEVLFTAKLLKVEPADYFEMYGGTRRRRPPYELRCYEKTRGIGYADNIYLNPIKQLVAAGMKNEGRIQLSCDFRNWYYLLEDFIAAGKFTYPDGRIIMIEGSKDGYYCGERKLIRPGVIVKDYVELCGRKFWYAADYTEASNDEKADVRIIFESGCVNAPLKFKGSFIRQSVARHEKTPGKIRGYIAYYRIKGVISTIGGNGDETSENIDLYNNENNMEEIADSFFGQETLPGSILTKALSVYQDPLFANSSGLDDLVGLNRVKQTFTEFKKFGEYRHKQLLAKKNAKVSGDKLLATYRHKIHERSTEETNDDAVSFHMVFLGSPGTGKTTVAKRVAAILKEYKIAVTNEMPLVVVKSDLVGQHVGHTEEITRKKIEEALNGILFIDEAHTLFESDNGNDFGKIALNEIMYAMEHYRDKLVVIFAGYTDEMLYMLKNANPGLASRVTWYFFFDDYSADELFQILERKLQENGYKLDENDINHIKVRIVDCFTTLKTKLDGIKYEGKTRHFFGNGRGVRTFFHYMQIGLATRLNKRKENEDLHTFKLEEVEFAYSKFKSGHGTLVKSKTTSIGFTSL